ncbi:MAG TPA: PPC domain-containing DNA-binding protein [Candidatus Saccharimonadales bacterium]|nr:PPC domain-containing DNA-binding protein [Candidatus Saccharimonadales bacterium]
MVHTFDGFNDFIRLQKGERLSDFLADFSPEEFPGAWVSGLGGVSEVTLGFYDLAAKEYRWKTFDGLREMTALQGNLAYDGTGKLMLHAHGTFADAQYISVGGHVKDFITAGTVELFLHRSYKPLNRKQDETVGLPLLDL